MNGSKKLRIVGWGLSLLLALLLIGGSAAGKFTEWEGKAEAFAHLGYSSELIAKIGVVEIVIALLFVIPRTGFLGAVLLTAYLGGAVATHVRVEDPYFAPIILGVVMWIALGLRQPEVFRLAFATANPAPPHSATAIK